VTAALPRVVRDGTRLVAAGRTVRIAGVNAYWLGLNDNARVRGVATLPTSATVDSLFAAARDLGSTVVRVHTLGTSYGDAERNGTPTLMPRPGVYRDDVWAHLDRVVDSAGRRGQRLVAVMSDRWNSYHGSGVELARLVLGRALSERAARSAFYRDQRVRDAFRDHLVAWLGHRSSISGLRYADDPTTLAIELGNEMYDVPRDWTRQMAAVVRSVAPEVLVIDPAAGLWLSQCKASLDCDDVDIVGVHGYPRSIGAVRQAVDLAGQAGKVAMVGEYDWTTNRQDGLSKEGSEDGTRDQWYAALEGAPGLGITTAWTLLVPSAGDHRDGYELYVPAQNAEQQGGAAALAGHLRRIAAM
jgi:mannan endo-1,4-beta-mannosidase